MFQCHGETAEANFITLKLYYPFEKSLEKPHVSKISLIGTINFPLLLIQICKLLPYSTEDKFYTDPQMDVKP